MKFNKKKVDRFLAEIEVIRDNIKAIRDDFERKLAENKKLCNR